MPGSHKPEFQVVEGIKIPPFFSKDCFQSALKFKPEPGDIFVATYPKCGTTWMQNILINVLRRAVPLERPTDFFLASPFLDQLGAEDSKKMMIRPGAYKTHLQFEKVPWSEDAKYIYVARNPKDCCVSFYHHMHQIPGYQFQDATFDEFFNLFITGDLEFDDYFPHLLSWYKHRHRPNILFTTYEDMQLNLKNIILKVADFVKEGEAKYLEQNPQVLDSILSNCTFEKMKFINDALNYVYRNIDAVLADPNLPRGRKHIAQYNSKLPVRRNDPLVFIRKGKVGDWRNVFNKEQNERMGKRINEMTKESDVMKLWKDCL